MLCIDIEKKMHTKSGLSTVSYAMNIPKKSCTGILGESGSGKTTLFNMISGIIAADLGTITLGDQIFFDSARTINLPMQKRNVGYMLQDPALFPHLTVEKNIAYGAKNRDFTAMITRLLELDRLTKKYPHELSGGQRQKTALARAICREPEILLLDEPWSSLDQSFVSVIINLISLIHVQTDTIILITSHQVSYLQSVCGLWYALSNSSIHRQDAGSIFCTRFPADEYLNEY